MPNPAHVGTTSDDFSFTTSVPVTFDGAATAGHYAYVLVATRKLSPAVTPPSGWNTLIAEASVNSDVEASLFGKTLESGDLAGVSFTVSPGDGGAWIACVVSDRDADSSVLEFDTTTASTTATAPAVSGLGQAAGDLALFFVIGEEGTGQVQASSPSLGTLRANPTGGGVTTKRPACGLSTYSLPSPSATADCTFTMSQSVTSFGLTVLARAAASGAVTVDLDSAIAVPVATVSPVIQVGSSGGGSGGGGGTPTVLDPNASGFTDYVGYRTSEVGDLSALPKEGVIVSSSNGQVISGRHCSAIEVRHSNVEIEDCLVAGTRRNLIENFAGKNANLTIRWTTLVGGEPSSNGGGYNGYTAYRCDVSGSADGFKANGEVTIEECWIHDLGRWRVNGGGFTHNDCVQCTGAGNSSNINLLRNRFEQNWRTTSCCKFTSESGNVSNVLIEGNRFIPGPDDQDNDGDGQTDDTNYAIYVTKKSQYTAPQNVRILNNTFVVGFRVGKFSIDAAADVVRQGNVDSDGTLIGGQTPGGENPPQPVDIVFDGVEARVSVVVEGMAITVGAPPVLPDVELEFPTPIGVSAVVPSDSIVTLDASVENPIDEGDEDDGEQVVTVNPTPAARVDGLAGQVRTRFPSRAGVRLADRPVGGLASRYRRGNR